MGVRGRSQEVSVAPGEREGSHYIINYHQRKMANNLKGKIINAPYPHIWFKIPESVCENEDYKYTYEKNRDWTPFNSNLHMQGIKVLVDNPVPENHQNPDSFEDTLLLDIVKEKRMKEMQQRKDDDMIRQMALEQKKKLEEKRKGQVLIKSPMF